MRVGADRPRSGALVTPALAATAAVLAVGASTRFAQEEPLTGRAPLAGVLLLVLAATALALFAWRVARTPAEEPLLARPWLAAVSVLVAVGPWLAWAEVPGSEGMKVDGWATLGTAAGWSAVVGGAVLGVLAAVPARRWHAAVPLAVAAVLLVAWLGADALDDTVLSTSPDVAISAAVLLVATLLAARPVRAGGAALDRDTLLAAVGGLALVALPGAMWGHEGIVVIGGDDGVSDPAYPASGWDLVPVVAALVTLAGLAGLVLALRRARATGGLRVPADTAALVAAGAALAGSSWLPWWNAATNATPWNALEWNAWALLAGGALVALGGVAGVRRPLLAVPPVVAAIVLADGIWRLEGALPPTGGAIVAAGAAVLAVATLLRPRPTAT